MRFRFIDNNKKRFRIVKMAEVLGVTKSGYYAWLKRQTKDKPLELDTKDGLCELIIQIFRDSRFTYGSRRIMGELTNKYKIQISRERVRRLMDKLSIHSMTNKKYKATTNSKHNYPVAENILNRDFYTEHPCQKMVSDITYVPTDEGWVYVAAVMDLYGRKIVGISMGDRMTQDLTIGALNDAIAHSGNVKGCILHSDRGSQYCANRYQNYLASYGFICSMSRKGNCWDNAPMESFWGKLKQEWLNEQHFKTREEAIKAVFEYVWVFYNRKRVSSVNGYLTPDEYYSQYA